MNDSSTSWLDRLRRRDRSRASWPGEHWITFASGLYFLMRSRRTALGRAASVATGAALVARAREVGQAFASLHQHVSL